MNISVHGVVEETGVEWQRLEQIMNFVRVALRERPDLYINLRLWNRSTENNAQLTDPNVEIMNFIERILGVPCLPVPPGRKSRRITGRLYLHQDSEFAWPGGRPLPAREHGFCHALSTHCAILVDGTVCPCCLDAQGQIPLGSLHQHSLTDILRGPRATAMREGFAHGRLVEKLCQSCSYCRRFTRHGHQHQRQKPLT